MKPLQSTLIIALLCLVFVACPQPTEETKDDDGKTPTNPLPPTSNGSRVADHTIMNVLYSGKLPVTAIQTAKSKLHIGYGHTSHGSQLANGMEGLIAFANGKGLSGAYVANQNLFTWNRGGTGGALDLREGNNTIGLNRDCGYYPDWVNETKKFLVNPENSEINVIIWSWCGQAANYTEADMKTKYLEPMAQLEKDYPSVTFVYMTCHLNGTGPNGKLHLRNEQIRAYCKANNKWLFDFADIESYDLAGTQNYNLLMADDACNYSINGSTKNWAKDWQTTHTQNTDWFDCSSAHSEAVNANQKAYAAWWLWCRLAGWDGEL